MKILNEEHFENVKRYAESIGDTSLQKCLERLKSWEENPDHPCEISLYYDHAPYSFGFTQCYPDGRTGIVGGLLYHGIPRTIYLHTGEPFRQHGKRHRADFRNIQSRHQRTGPAGGGTRPQTATQKKEETPFTRHILIVNYQPSKFLQLCNKKMI